MYAFRYHLTFGFILPQEIPMESVDFDIDKICLGPFQEVFQV